MLRARVWRPIVAVSIVLITALVFANYFVDHPEIWWRLQDTSPVLLLSLLGLYGLFIGSLALINTGTLKLCQATLQRGEGLVLAIYSSIINFFGPLQSGPAFRALYLKHKHGVKLRDYTAASFVYYFFYALFSGACLLSGVLGWWLLMPAALIGLGLVYLRRSQSPRLAALRNLAKGNWHYLVLATLAQVILLVIIYYVELRAVLPGVTLGQAVIYTGAANFALFVSLTPGAIGFRESFLVFSQDLHDINTTAIVAASTIDRAVYIVLLLILAVYIFGSHANKRLQTIIAKP